jgi:hypothetical protein
LISAIKKHFDYVYSHQEIYWNATRFHRQLATFYPIDTIITTNWDPYFEDICGATAFVEDKDIALWEVAQRRVLKVHGTIANFGSIVATRSDYERCAKRLEEGTLGAHLKSLLSTRTIVFIGYSLLDDDFLQVYGVVRKCLAEFHRQPYFISPYIEDADRGRLEKLNLYLIETDGEFFIEQLKLHAQSRSCISSDDMYDDVGALYERVMEAHNWLNQTFSAFDYPQTLIANWYQDGLQHILERILRLRKTGEYSDLHRLIAGTQHYSYYAKRFRQDGNFCDAAYCEGYANGLMYASFPSADRSKTAPPLFFHFGGFQTDRKTLYKNTVKKLPGIHKAAYKFVLNTMGKHRREDNLIIHHIPQLSLGKYVAELEDRRNKRA